MGAPLGYPGVGTAGVTHAPYPVDVSVTPALEARHRLTTAFRPVLALPHLMLVGGPLAIAVFWVWSDREGLRTQWSSAGVLGAVAFVAALISWFAILFTGTQPDGLRGLVAFYLRWRVHAIAYVTLLRDEYPPFGDGEYEASFMLAPLSAPRDRLTVAFRPLLAIPHLVVLVVLGVAWAIATLAAWFAILFTGRHPAALHRFGTGMLRWSTRVEAYLLLLHDEYPPFSLA